MLKESDTSQLLSQLLYDAVAQEKLQILALQIALHQVCYGLSVVVTNIKMSPCLLKQCPEFSEFCHVNECAKLKTFVCHS